MPGGEVVGSKTRKPQLAGILQALGPGKATAARAGTDAAGAEGESGPG